MSKHTPGPWKAVQVPREQDGPAYCFEIEAGPDVVADVYDLFGDGGESAARLIAAAPDLLAELRSILEFLEAREIGLHRQETIRQVIAKACP